MAITMQGSWMLRVKTRNAAFSQRFVVSGATTGNGTYDGIVGNAVLVTGPQWTVHIQHQPTRQAWRDSAQRLGLPGVVAGLLSFDMAANDGGLDDDYDDLVLACSLPVSPSDYVVYGTAKTYSGACLFNPCRDDYIVIDSPLRLGSVYARHPQLREVIKKLYPERTREEHRPMRDSESDLTPLLIPTGLPNVAVGLLFQSHLARAPEPAEVPMASESVHAAADRLDQAEADALRALQATIRRVPFKPATLKAGVGRLAHSELETIAKIRDAAIRFRCDLERAPGLLLRFQEYDRTAAEQQGGSYTGTGSREHLGLAVTDELGNYIFRFSRAPSAAAIGTAGLAAGEALAAELRPDVIVQVMGRGLALNFETAPYDNIANLRRIDLCVPHAQVHADGCAGASDHAARRADDGATLRASVYGRQARPQPSLAAHPRTVFEYVGATALMVVGPATGRCYRFERPGATVAVDLLDRATLAGIHSLRMQQAA